MFQQGHSPLGASGAYRWMVCPGSVPASEGVTDDESEFAALGTAGHVLGEICLHGGSAAWEYIGDIIHSGELWDADCVEEPGPGCITVDKDMADAVQVYCDAIKEWHPDYREKLCGNYDFAYIEQSFHCPRIHELFYGTSDFGYVCRETRTIYVWDYKHGAGVVVDAEDNSQLKYYAAGVLEQLGLWNDIDRVVLLIAQPRGWMAPVRHWECTTDDLDAWVFDELVPAMNRAQAAKKTDLVQGDHCMFCPVRGRCTLKVQTFDRVVQLMEKKDVKDLTAAERAEVLAAEEDLKPFLSANRKKVFAAMQGGKKVPGFKLVKKKADRQWKDGAEKALKDKYGDRAYVPAKIKSPAQIEAMPGGDKLAIKWAEKPDTGLTIAKASDKRSEVSTSAKDFVKQRRNANGKK